MFRSNLRSRERTTAPAIEIFARRRQSKKTVFRALLRTRQTLSPARYFLPAVLSYRYLIYIENSSLWTVGRTKSREEKGEIVDYVDGRDTWRRRGKSSIPRQLDRRCSCFAPLSISLFCSRFRDRDFSPNNAVFFDETNLHSNSLRLFFRGHASNFLYFPRFHQRGFLESLQTSRPRDFLDRLKRFLNRDKDRDLITRARVIILRAYKDS